MLGISREIFLCAFLFPGIVGDEPVQALAKLRVGLSRAKVSGVSDDVRDVAAFDQKADLLRCLLLLHSERTIQRNVVKEVLRLLLFEPALQESFADWRDVAKHGEYAWVLEGSGVRADEGLGLDVVVIDVNGCDPQERLLWICCVAVAVVVVVVVVVLVVVVVVVVVAVVVVVVVGVVVGGSSRWWW